MLSPLPLTPFEEYMLADDRPEWPMVFYLKLRLSRTPEPAQLAVAANRTIARHPLLGSLIERDLRGRWQWRHAPEAQPRIDWRHGNEPLDESQSRWIDLRQEPGWRLAVDGVASHDRADGESTLTLTFHHSCCDGLAALQVAADLLAAYNEGTDQASSLQPLQPDKLPRRASLGHSWWRQLLRLPQELLGALGTVEFFSHRPLSLIGQNPKPPGIVAVAPAYRSHRFSADESDRLRQTARALRVTLNDLLLASLFIATDRSLTDSGLQGKRMLRLIIPVSLRSAAQQGLSAANVVSMVNLDRRLDGVADPGKFLDWLSRETALIKRCRLGLTLLHIARFARRWGLLERLLPTDRCLSTAVLSNLGAPAILTDLAGPQTNTKLDLISLEFMPPIRPLTAAALGVVTFRGQTTVTLHFDPALTTERAAQLLRDFVKTLQNWPV